MVTGAYQLVKNRKIPIQDLYRISAVLSFSFFVLYGVFTNSNFHLLLAFIFGSPPFLFFIKKEYNRTPYSTKVYIFILLLAYPVSIILNGFAGGYFTLPMVLSSIGVAYVFATNKKLIKVVEYLLIALLIYFIIQLLLFGKTGDEVYVGSRNRKSIIFIGLSIFLFVLEHPKRSNVYVAFLVLIANLLAVGSAGIISGLMLFLFTFMTNAKYFNKYLVVVSCILLLIIPSYVYHVYFSDSTSEALLKMSTERLFSSDIRYEIWTEYINKYLKGWHLFLGAPFDFKFVASFQGNYEEYTNLHSSYLMLHVKTGILSIFLISIIMLKLLKLSFKRLYYAGLFATILFRSFSDTCFILDGSFNYAFYIFFLPEYILFRDKTRQLHN